MQIKRTSKAHWSGTGKEGKGNLSTPSNILNQSPYSFLTRFENEAGTNFNKTNGGITMIRDERSSFSHFVQGINNNFILINFNKVKTIKNNLLPKNCFS